MELLFLFYRINKINRVKPAEPTKKPPNFIQINNQLKIRKIEKNLNI